MKIMFNLYKKAIPALLNQVTVQRDMILMMYMIMMSLMIMLLILQKSLLMMNLEKTAVKHTNMVMRKRMIIGWMKWENNEQEVATMAFHD